MRVFYALFVEDPFLEQVLNGIRLLCDPMEKHSAHITVRGPYRQHYSLRAQNSIIRGSLIEVDGAGKFWSEKQHTVFLQCDSRELRQVWYKPDYPEYAPHITIYDGKSRDFAQLVFQCLDACAPHFWFRASGLRPLASSKGQSTLDLIACLDLKLLRDLTSEDLHVADFQMMDEARRLRLITKLCGHLKQDQIPQATKNQDGRLDWANPARPTQTPRSRPELVPAWSQLSFAEAGD